MVTLLPRRGLGFKALSTPKSMMLETGTAYMVKEERPLQSYKTFSELSREMNGLIITRIHPYRVKKRFGISGEILWLSAIEGKNTIEPTQLSKMAFIVSHFLKTNMGGAVLLDGLEYLILQNDFDSVLKFLYLVTDSISLHNGILLLPISPKTLTGCQMKMLERELEPF